MAHFLSPSQHEKLARAINRELDIPLLSSNREYDICLKLARAIDSAIEARVPDEMLDGLNRPEVQVEALVADALKDNLTPLLADLLSIPFFPTDIKRRVINFAVELLVDVMASYTTLDERIESFFAEA